MSTWVDVITDYICGHISSGRRDRSPFSPGPEPGETAPEPKLGCGLLFDPGAAEAAWGLLWGSLRRHDDQGALSTPGGVHRKGDLVGETGNPLVGARARPEGKIVSVTIAGRAGDPLF